MAGEQSTAFDLETVRLLLERLRREYHRPQFLGTDPLSVPHRFEDAADREAAALIAASFAFGNVKSILDVVDRILRPLLPHPAKALKEREPGDWRNRYRGFVYRWVRGADLRIYLSWIGSALREYGSLGEAWRAVDRPREEETILPALGRWVGDLTGRPTKGLRSRKRSLHRTGRRPSPLPSGAHLLLTSPDGKSTCKRMNLFLRWVCRPDDGIDLGLWKVDPSRLIMPVDTHVLQAARILGLTGRPSADLRTAEEITANLRRICPDDPCRYDFSLTRPGIMRLRGEWDRLSRQAG